MFFFNEKGIENVTNVYQIYKEYFHIFLNFFLAIIRIKNKPLKIC